MKKDDSSVNETVGESDAPEASGSDTMADVEDGKTEAGEEDARGDRGDQDSVPSSSQVEELREELQALNDRHLRLAAEFDNYRKRSQAELGSSGVRAQAALVQNLLEVLDDFHRVTSMDPDGATVESLLEGVGMVERKLHRILEEAGLEPLEPENEPFDPNEMEAMVRVPTDSPDEDDTVDQVLQTGFRFRGRLVRPARVSVRKYD
jgi:molecular chaperone GrpE